MDSIQETDYSIEAAKGVPNSTSETAFIPTTKASQKVFFNLIQKNFCYY